MHLVTLRRNAVYLADFPSVAVPVAAWSWCCHKTSVRQWIHASSSVKPQGCRYASYESRRRARQEIRGARKVIANNPASFLAPRCIPPVALLLEAHSNHLPASFTIGKFKALVDYLRSRLGFPIFTMKDHVAVLRRGK